MWPQYYIGMKDEQLFLLIDLDGTVYDRHNGLMDEMTRRIDLFMEHKLGIPKADIAATRNKYYSTYGSTLSGIQMFHKVDPVEYLEFIHDLDLSRFLKPDPRLRKSLASIPHPKWIFTNSDRNHTLRILKYLQIDDLFEGIMDVWEMSFIPKPHSWTYTHAMECIGNPDPRRIVFVEDTLTNLDVPHALGWNTVWITDSLSHPKASFNIPKLMYLKDVIGQIEFSSWIEGNLARHNEIAII